jgi:hypothetical protein
MERHLVAPTTGRPRRQSVGAAADSSGCGLAGAAIAPNAHEVEWNVGVATSRGDCADAVFEQPRHFSGVRA